MVILMYKTEEIKEKIYNILSEFNIHDVENFGKEINSIIFIELIVLIETEFDILIADEQLSLDKLGTFDSLKKLVEEQVQIEK